MKIRWPETILKNREPYTWIEANLFPTDFLDPVGLEATEVLYHCDLSPPLLEFVVFGSPRPAPPLESTGVDGMNHSRLM